MDEFTSPQILSMEEKKELYVATLVHDLKNPLNAQIIALEQLYKEKFGSLTPIQKEILNDIISSSKFMREMLSTLLYVYKFENGNIILKKTLVNIFELINVCIKDIAALADEHAILLQVLNNSNISTILCDENYIRRVIFNMLNNILSYSYKNTKALITLDNIENWMLIIFKNTGYPIDDNLKEHIFEKYNNGGHKKSGMGLGLYFCKKVLEAHGGTIQLNSKNTDIEFLLKLPIK